MVLPSLPPSIYVAFSVSFLCTVMLVLSKNLHGRFSMDSLVGIQKQHTQLTPRIGGLSLVIGVFAGWVVAMPERRSILWPLLVAGLPAFLFGFAEDLTKKVSIKARLAATFVSGVLGWLMTGIAITSVDIPLFDQLLGFVFFSVCFSAFCVSGIANSINIIDGFNGLASGVVTIALAGIAAIALSQSDFNLAVSCLCVASSMLGFWLVNWPWGKIFLGDGGSYFGGFALAWACIMLVERNPNVTPFAALLVCIHPITEVLFSVYRRRVRSHHIGQPDRLHLHSLVMRRIARPMLSKIDGQTKVNYSNALTGLMLALMTLPLAICSYYLHTKPLLAAAACFTYSVLYLVLYARLVRYHWCSPIKFLFYKSVHSSGKGNCSSNA